MWLLSLTTSALLLVLTASAEKCVAPPLNLPYRNVSVTPGVLHTGIPLQIGSPWQSIALLPSLQTDDTFLPRYTNTCLYESPPPANTTAANRTTISTYPRFSTNLHDEGAWWTACAALYGGAYTPALSPTFSENRTNNQAFHYFTDVWRFADYIDAYAGMHGALPAQPNLTSTFLIAEPGETFHGYGSALLGLTPNSTLLTALKQAGVAPSTSWSLVAGETLCLGCVDAEAQAGEPHTFAPTVHDRDQEGTCVLRVDVEALDWRPKAGGEGATLILEKFAACIDPGVKFLVLPPAATQSFKNITGRRVSAEYADSLVFDGPPANSTGVLTFRLAGGLQVNVTVRGEGTVGAEVPGSWTVPFGNGAWGAYGNQTWVLGKPFTDAVVLRWDSAKEEYAIANLNPNRSSPSFQPLGCDSFPSLGNPGTSAPTAGALVGSIVGGFFGGLAFAAAGFFSFKCGQKGVKAKYAHLDEDTLLMRAMSTSRDSWMTGALASPPPPSTRESLRAQPEPQAGVQGGEGLEVPDSQLYEAPGGGTAYPTKMQRSEFL